MIANRAGSRHHHDALIRLVALLSLLALWWVAEAALAASPRPAYEWAGTLEVTMHGPKQSAEGELTTRWRFDVRWREAERVAVRDAEGRLAGEFVLLEDDGTAWTGHRHGLLRETRDCIVAVTRYEGAGSGDRSIDVGWLYFSNVVEGPLAGRLPDGSYHLYSGGADAEIAGTAATTYHDTCRGVTSTHRRAGSLPPLAFSLGRERLHPAAARAGFSAERLAETIDNLERVPASRAAFLDPERRRAEGSSMAGSYRTVRDDGQLLWEVTWDVERRPVRTAGQPPRPLTITSGSRTASVAPFASTSRNP